MKVASLQYSLLYLKFLSKYSLFRQHSSENVFVILTIISIGQWVVPGGESISTIFESVGDVVLSVYDNLISFTKINLGWSLWGVISDLGSMLEKDLVIILAIVSIGQWVMPGSQLIWHGSIFETVGNIVFSVNNKVVKLSIIWRYSPLDEWGISSSEEGSIIISLHETLSFRIVRVSVLFTFCGSRSSSNNSFANSNNSWW